MIPVYIIHTASLPSNPSLYISHGKSFSSWKTPIQGTNALLKHREGGYPTQPTVFAVGAPSKRHTHHLHTSYYTRYHILYHVSCLIWNIAQALYHRSYRISHSTSRQITSNIIWLLHFEAPKKILSHHSISICLIRFIGAMFWVLWLRRHPWPNARELHALKLWRNRWFTLSYWKMAKANPKKQFTCQLGYKSTTLRVKPFNKGSIFP